MKILIVGSKGFIGSHCVDYFCKEHEVWECDVIFDFSNPRYINIDAVDSDFIDLFREHQFDLCINCSGAANVPFSLERPLNDFRLNTLNVIRLLEAIRIYNKSCKFITMSSAAVYGNPTSLPISVSAQTAPVSPYGYHKVFAEQACEEYTRFWDIQTCCVRIFSAFGPRLKKQLFWDMYRKFQNNDIIELWGTGKESRDFIYITDLISALDLVIKNADFKGTVVNIANGVQTTIQQVADSFVHVLKTEKAVKFNGAVRVGDPINWEADITDLKSWGYEPKVSIEQGIQEFVLWAQNESESV